MFSSPESNTNTDNSNNEQPHLIPPTISIDNSSLLFSTPINTNKSTTTTTPSSNTTTKYSSYISNNLHKSVSFLLGSPLLQSDINTSNTDNRTPTRFTNITTTTTSSIKSLSSSSSNYDSVRTLAFRLKIVLAIVGLTLTRAIQAMWMSRPLLVTALGLYCCFLGLYLNEDRSQQWFHTSHRQENRFWMASTFLLASSVVFAPDSPLYVYEYSSDWWMGGLTGLTSVIALVYSAHLGHKLSHWSTLAKKARIPKNKSYRDAIGMLDEGEVENMDELLARIHTSVAKLESALIPGGVKRYWERNNLLQLERTVVETFAECTRAELNYLILHLNLNVVLYRLKNHGVTSSTTTTTTTTSTFTTAALQGLWKSRLATTTTTTMTTTGIPPINTTPTTTTTTIVDISKDPPASANNNTNINPPTPSTSPPSSLSSTIIPPDDYKSHMERCNHRHALVTILAFKRIQDLTISARVAVLDSIQVVGLMRNPDTANIAVAGVTNIILNTLGRQLSKLKTFMDAKGSFHSMHKLVYDDIEDETVRGQLVSHFQVQGKVASNNNVRGRKVISDVDDTLMSSGGRYPAGIDDKYPRHFVYPGAFAFYESLDMNFLKRQDDSSSSAMDTEEEQDVGNVPNNNNNKNTRKVGNLVFLSARPHVYKDISEKRVYAKFEKMIRGQNLHSMPTLLPGDLESGQAYMLRGDFEPMAQKKLKNIVEYHSIYPEFSHIFIGDNGQADVRAAELMIERFGDDLEAVFIHLVQPLAHTFGYHEQTSYRKWISSGKMIFYNTFAGAASEACRRGFIEVEALERVLHTCVNEFKTLPLNKVPGGFLGQERRRLELVNDFVTANTILEEYGLDCIDPPEASCHFPVGSTIYARNWGEGFVRSFRPNDGIYEVVLREGKIIGFFSLFDLATSPFLNSGMFVGMGNHIPATTTHHHHHLPKENDYLVFQPGSKVNVIHFGPGIVRRHRRNDDIVEITFTNWNAVGFVHSKNVQLQLQQPTEQDNSNLWKFVGTTWGNIMNRGMRSGGNIVPINTTIVGTTPTTTASNNPPPSPSLSSISSRASSVSARFEIGSKIKTKFGIGIVGSESREMEDGIIVLHFPSWHAVGYFHYKELLLSLDEVDSPVLVPSSTTNTTTSSSSSGFGSVFSKLRNSATKKSPITTKPIINTLRKFTPFSLAAQFGSSSSNSNSTPSATTTTTNNDNNKTIAAVTSLNTTTTTTSLSSLDVIDNFISINNNNNDHILVHTPYGNGILLDHNKQDHNMCKIKLDWGATLYCLENVIQIVASPLQQQQQPVPSPTSASSHYNYDNSVSNNNSNSGMSTPTSSSLLASNAKNLSGIFFSKAETQTNKILSLLTNRSSSSNNNNSPTATAVTTATTTTSSTL
jgi:hypothetical protein